MEETCLRKYKRTSRNRGGQQDQEVEDEGHAWRMLLRTSVLTFAPVLSLYLGLCALLLQSVDFARVEMSSLLRYKRHFKLPVRPQASKSELISHIRKHF